MGVIAVRWRSSSGFPPLAPTMQAGQGSWMGAYIVENHGKTQREAQVWKDPNSTAGTDHAQQVGHGGGEGSCEAQGWGSAVGLGGTMHAAHAAGVPQQAAAQPQQHHIHHYARDPPDAAGETGGASGLVPSLASGVLPNGLPRPKVGQHVHLGEHGGGRTGSAPGATRPNAGAALPRRRLLDYYDFYRTPDNKKVRLGGGNYATVWKGVSRTTGEEVAFKIIVKNDVTVAEANPMHAEILKMVDHKHIIQLKDYFDEAEILKIHCRTLILFTHYARMLTFQNFCQRTGKGTMPGARAGDRGGHCRARPQRGSVYGGGGGQVQPPDLDCTRPLPQAGPGSLRHQGP